MFRLRRYPVLTTVLLCTSFCHSQQFIPTRVLLDRVTFGTDYDQMQRVADAVSKKIDELIPGINDPEESEVFCFQTFGKEKLFNREDHPPITLHGRIVASYEPRTVRPGQLRIAVDVTPNSPQQFAYQLAHELAHVKMGTADNYLIETLAVAVSHAVVSAISIATIPPSSGQTYVDQAVAACLSQAPVSMQIAYRSHNYGRLRKLWQDQAMRENGTLDDRSFQTVGAQLVLSRPVSWQPLLGIAAPDQKQPIDALNTFQKIPPTSTRYKIIEPILSRLGFPKSWSYPFQQNAVLAIKKCD